MENMTPLSLTGVVQSGGPANPKTFSGVTVRIFEATADQPLIVGTTTTGAQGTFQLTLARDASERIFYATATVGLGVELVTIIGPLVVLHAAITINELTTVAAAFSM